MAARDLGSIAAAVAEEALAAARSSYSSSAPSSERGGRGRNEEEGGKLEARFHVRTRFSIGTDDVSQFSRPNADIPGPLLPPGPLVVNTFERCKWNPLRCHLLGPRVSLSRPADPRDAIMKLDTYFVQILVQHLRRQQYSLSHS